MSRFPPLPKPVLSRHDNVGEEMAMARNRRAYGTGSLYIENGIYYGRWRTADGGNANRRVGPVRAPGTSQGLTKRQAEAKLREMMDGAHGRVAAAPKRTIEHVGSLQAASLAAQGRKVSHVETLESHVRVHLAPFFGTAQISRIDAVDVERLMAKLRKQGLAPKTIKNVLGSLHSIFDYGLRKGWVAENPCRLVEKPDTRNADPDTRRCDSTVVEEERIQASVPALPGTISVGVSRSEAREDVLDALEEMLAAPATGVEGRSVETLRARLEAHVPELSASSDSAGRARQIRRTNTVEHRMPAVSQLAQSDHAVRHEPTITVASMQKHRDSCSGGRQGPRGAFS